MSITNLDFTLLLFLYIILCIQPLYRVYIVYICIYTRIYTLQCFFFFNIKWLSVFHPWWFHGTYSSQRHRCCCLCGIPSAEDRAWKMVSHLFLAMGSRVFLPVIWGCIICSHLLSGSRIWLKSDSTQWISFGILLIKLLALEEEMVRYFSLPFFSFVVFLITFLDSSRITVYHSSGHESYDWMLVRYLYMAGYQKVLFMWNVSPNSGCFPSFLAFSSPPTLQFKGRCIRNTLRNRCVCFWII